MSAVTKRAVEPWDEVLVERECGGGLVSIAREGRLVREERDGPARVHLSLVDECALVLVDLALRRGTSISFVYPAPAGEVAILLAAQILLHRFLRGERTLSVGLLTADTVTASRTWEGLRIRTVGDRAPISDVFQCVRCGPEGGVSLHRGRFQGLLVGQRWDNWPVDTLVVDHLAGPVDVKPNVSAIHIFADPLDPAIAALAASEELIWGWSAADVARVVQAQSDVVQEATTPFSVGEERLEAIARGVRATIYVAHAHEAERCVQRIRDDLWTLADLFGDTAPPGVLRGLRVAWHHLRTLVSLPCRPSEFDRFAGLPPIAARPTGSFEREIAAWAKSLTGDAGEIAAVLASDLADLRSMLEVSNPFVPELHSLIGGDREAIVVVRTNTAARALVDTMGGDLNALKIGKTRVLSFRRLHREGSWPRAITVGIPPSWDWHRLDSGLSGDLRVLVLGAADGRRSAAALADLEAARERWGGDGARAKVWKILVGGEPPPVGACDGVQVKVSVVDALEAAPEVDPFARFESLMESSPLVVGDAGIEEAVAEQAEDGSWSADVEAVEVRTAIGTILLPYRRMVEVRNGERIVDCRADHLQPGMRLLISRQGGRLGLLDSMAERLTRHRPDVLVANMLVRDLHERVHSAFRASGMTVASLFERLIERGFDKTCQAARGYVDEDGPLAPRDLPDLRRLNLALELGFSERRVQEVFAAVQRVRTFRRAVGRTLASAAREAVVAGDATRVDPETGMSVADLRDTISEAEVEYVRKCDGTVPLAEIGHLRPDE